MSLSRLEWGRVSAFLNRLSYAAVSQIIVPMWILPIRRSLARTINDARPFSILLEGEEFEVERPLDEPGERKSGDAE